MNYNTEINQFTLNTELFLQKIKNVNNDIFNKNHILNDLKILIKFKIQNKIQNILQNKFITILQNKKDLLNKITINLYGWGGSDGSGSISIGGGIGSGGIGSGGK